MNGPTAPGPDESPLSLLGRSAPASSDVRLVAIAPHCELAYEPSEWVGALVVVEAGEIEIECRRGARGRFGAGSVLFFDGLALGALRNPGSEPVLLSAATRRPRAATSPPCPADDSRPGPTDSGNRHHRGVESPPW